MWNLKGISILEGKEKTEKKKNIIQEPIYTLSMKPSDIIEW